MLDSDSLLASVRSYWNEHLHDESIARHPIGSREFFDELEEYRFEKLDYLGRILDFSAFKGRSVLEVGCGLGIDLSRFARSGAQTIGVDLAERPLQLAKENFVQLDLPGEFVVANGEALPFPDARFDLVYAHGLLQYAPRTDGVISEIHRVLKSGGEAFLVGYNRISWLNFLSFLFRVRLEHQDAPVLKKFSISEFRKLLTAFSRIEITPERFPVESRLQTGLKAAVYNKGFVRNFNRLPRGLVKPLGWHLIAKVGK